MCQCRIPKESIVERPQPACFDQSLHNPNKVRHVLPNSTFGSNERQDPWARCQTRAEGSVTDFEPMLPYLPRPGLVLLLAWVHQETRRGGPEPGDGQYQHIVHQFTLSAV